MSSRLKVLFGATAVVSVVGVWAMLAGTQEPATLSVDITSSDTGVVEPEDLESQGATPWDNEVLPYQTRVAPLPESLRGTRLDHPLAVDEQGHLRISNDIRMVFDFFLAAVHEEDVETILQRIEEYLEYQLDEPALSEAKTMLGNYIAMKEALFVYEEEQSARLQAAVADGSLKEQSLTLLEAQLSARNALRAEHLGAEVHEAFFADEEAYDAYTLARMKVMRDTQLNEAEKQRALAEIDAQAPRELVESRRETQIIDELQHQEIALKESGASQQEIRQLRAEMFGVEAAERFDQLDQERAAWQQRLDAFINARRAILANQGLTEKDRAREIDRLRQERFDEREQIRVRVYERMADNAASSS